MSLTDPYCGWPLKRYRARRNPNREQKNPELAHYMLIRALYVLLVAAVLSLLPFPAFAQQATLDPLPLEGVFHERVKQFDDFVERFNQISTATMEDRIETEGEPGLRSDRFAERGTALLALFDQSDPRFQREDPAYAPAYIALVQQFIEEVLRDSLTIKRHSEKILARAGMHGELDGKAVRLTTLMQQEQPAPGMLQWVMRDVEADFLEVMENDTSMLRFLPPTSAELDFKDLLRAMDDRGHQQDYAHREFRYDRLSVFFYLLNTDRLYLDHVTEVQYLIEDLPGWRLVLKDFNRQSTNSGWLISELEQIPR